MLTATTTATGRTEKPMHIDVMHARGGSASPLAVAVAIAIGLLAGGVGTVWAAQGSDTVDPPPSVAFVASAFNYPDALAAGPIAGRLGAPLLLTASHSLSDEAADGLTAADPDLVIIAGGTVAVSQTVEDQIATMLPGTTIERAAGATRTETAELLAELIARFNPAWLPVEATAADADLLDGMDSEAFLTGAVFYFKNGSGRLAANDTPQAIVQIDVPDGTYVEMEWLVGMELEPDFQDRDDWDGTVDCMWMDGTNDEVSSSSRMHPADSGDHGQHPFSEIAGGDGITLECTNNLTYGDESEQAEIEIFVSDVHLKPATILTEK